MRTHPHGILNGADGVGRIPPAIVAEELQRHDADLPIHPGDAADIVAHSADGPRHMGTVTVSIHRIPIPIGKIIPVHIVDIAIIVVIHAVRGNFTGIGPHISGQIGMGIIDPGIDHGDDDIATANGLIPGIHRADVGPRLAAKLPAILHGP